MLEDTRETECFHLGDIVVSPRGLTISSPKGENRIEPKVMYLLSVLAETPGRIWTRDELIDRVWGVTFGGDESLTRAVSLLRKALREPHCLDDAVRTVSKSGYQLTTAVTRPNCQDRLLYGQTHSAARAMTVLAVLPFDDLSPDANMQFFADGISDEIIGRLARGSDIRMIGRVSSFQYRGDRKADAAADLGASHILDGSVRRDGEHVRISVHLLETASSTTRWSARFDEVISDVLGLQDRIAESTATALDAAFHAPNPGLIDPETYDLYLQARHILLAPDTLEQAIGTLERVIVAAPSFSPAWGLLADLRAWQRFYAPTSERAAIRRRVEIEIEQCTKLDPDNADALAARVRLSDPYGEFLTVEQLCERIEAIGTSSAVLHYLIAFMRLNVGRVGDALNFAERAMDLDPVDPNYRHFHSACLYYAGRLEEARSALVRVLQRWPDDHHCAASLLACSALMQDRDLFESVADPKRLEHYPLHQYMPLVDVWRMEFTDFSEQRGGFVDAVKQRAQVTGCIDPILLNFVARFGSPDEAHRLIETAHLGPGNTEHDAMGPIAYRPLVFFFKDYPDLRSDPRFLQLCARLGLAEYWLETGNWPDCVDEDHGYDFKAECVKAAATIPKEAFRH